VCGWWSSRLGRARSHDISAPSPNDPVIQEFTPLDASVAEVLKDRDSASRLLELLFDSWYFLWWSRLECELVEVGGAGEEYAAFLLVASALVRQLLEARDTRELTRLQQRLHAPTCSSSTF
jgi:hypothetical protein